MRIIITGSRTWTDVDRIRRVLMPILNANPDAVLVHGDADGADKIGRDVWVGAGGQCDPHRVTRQMWLRPCTDECDHGPRKLRTDGTSYCPAVAHRRNQRMADAGADRCIAFRMPGVSDGTDDMIERAARAGIPVRVFTPRDPDALF